jgi:hypothetical protein
MWLRAFPTPYQSLLQLDLSGSIAAGLIDALAYHEGGLPKRPRENEKAQPTDGVPCFFFGGLQALGLREVDMRKVTSGTSTLREVFLQHLELRGMANIPLQKLNMDHCKGLRCNDQSRIQVGKWAQDIVWNHCDPDDEEHNTYDEEEDSEDEHTDSDDS